MKLTNATRDEIVQLVLIDVFTARAKELDTKELELGDAIYSHFFGDTEGDMLKFPEGFFAERSIAQFRIGDRRYSHEVKMSRSRRVGYRHYHGTFGLLEENHALVAAYHALTDARLTLNKEEQQIKLATRQLVYSATTHKRLLELWPEGEKYLPKASAGTANLPAVTAVNLNSLIAQYKKAA